MFTAQGVNASIRHARIYTGDLHSLPTWLKFDFYPIQALAIGGICYEPVVHPDGRVDSAWSSAAFRQGCDEVKAMAALPDAIQLPHVALMVVGWGDAASATDNGARSAMLEVMTLMNLSSASKQTMSGMVRTVLL